MKYVLKFAVAYKVRRFRQNRSIISPLLTYYEDIISKLKNRDEVDVIYLAFSKASLKVDHRMLVLKIEAFSITGKNFPRLERLCYNKSKLIITYS